MKKVFFNSILGISILSWIFFLTLTFITFSPSAFIKTIDHYILPSYLIEFSKLENSGNALNHNLKFSDLQIIHNEKLLLKAKKLELGLSLHPQIFFKPLTISNLLIKDGHLNHLDSSSKHAFQNYLVDFNNEVSLSFQNFIYARNNSSIEINGGLYGDLSKSLSGQLSFLHEDNLSTIAIKILENSYRFSLNLHSYQWLSLVPFFSSSPLKDLTFQMNALGEFRENKSIIKGFFNSNSLSLNSLIIKPNKGSFEFQFHENIGTLKLTEFLHPFIDEKYPIQVNLPKRSLTVPKFLISPQALELEKFQLSNLVIENLFLSFKNQHLKYSGFIRDLDLKEIYFDEILNIVGAFAGYDGSIKFSVNSNSSLLKNKDNIFIPVSIIGTGDYTSAGLDIIAQIKNKSANVDLALQINPESANPLSIELKGKDVSKELIELSLPQSLARVGAFINKSILLGRKNSIYLNFLSSRKSSQSSFKSKILTNESKLIVNQGANIDFSRPLIEFDNKNLYVFSPHGKVSNFSYDEVHGVLNYKTQKLSFFSSHTINPKNLKESLGYIEKNFNLPSIEAIHKGQIYLPTLRVDNAISVKTKKFSFPVTKSLDIKINKGNIYIVNLDLIHGFLPSTFLNDEISIVLNGIGLTKDYDLTFSTDINLEPEKYFPNLDYFKILGKDLFAVDLNIQNDATPILNIYSDLKRIELYSQLNFLRKDKFVTLPTKITIENLLRPSIKVVNQMIDMHIRDLEKLDGYISLGKKLPEEFHHFSKNTGLNLYINSKLITLNELNSISFSQPKTQSVNFSSFAFDFDNLKFSKNIFSNVSGLFDLNNSEIKGKLASDRLNVNFRMDKTGFIRIELNDSTISDIEFINSEQSILDTVFNSRFIVRNSSFGKINVKELDMYLLNNKKHFTANNIKLNSNLMSIAPLKESSIAYFSIDKDKPLYKIRGDFLIKDSKKIPYLKDYADFSYFNGSINLQWKELSKLSHIEGEGKFILKDLVVEDSLSNSLAFNLLGVLNLRNILGKVANLDLSIDEFTSTQLSRVEGDLLFNKSKLRLVSPLFIETNAAKMKWVGQINNNSKNYLNELDLNLDLRIRVGENLPWYAAILGGLPAVAGSAVIKEIFEEDINELTNYQYEILGTISQPKLQRIK